MEICIKRVYEAASSEDGYRVLVDRLWPRGVSREKLIMDSWEKDVTPSNELRRLWHSGDISDNEFYANYEAELEEPLHTRAAKRLLQAAATADRLTLLVATKDVKRSHAHVLSRFLYHIQKEIKV